MSIYGSKHTTGPLEEVLISKHAWNEIGTAKINSFLLKVLGISSIHI
jgi:alkyl sulfatase BDS1-like metallo-beta-lactamase superfamily hydrolase